MTVFPDGTKEALHGHHYQPSVSISLAPVAFEKMISFSEVKTSMKKLAALWDEKVLLATENPFFKIADFNSKKIDFTLCGKHYVLPSDEVVMLKVDNITCENLARAYFEFLEADLECLKRPEIKSISVFIEESPGQGAGYTREMNA